MVFAGSLSFAALLAPFAHAGLAALSPDAPWPPARVFNRLAQLLAATQLVVWRRSLGGSALRGYLTSVPVRRRLSELAAGLTSSFIAIVLASAWAVASGDLGRTLNAYEFFAHRTATALLGALATSLIEESFFRGIMIGSLASRWGWWKAAIATNVAYASVHCLVSDRSIVWHGPAGADGFAPLFRAFATLLEPASWPPLLGLFLGGLTLAWAVRRSGSLWPAIGLHAGWTFSFQVSQHATRVLVDIQGMPYFAARNWLLGRPWAWAAMLGSGGIALLWMAFGRSRADR
jgi:membrane protease YdiL (CAAX protease family)